MWWTLIVSWFYHLGLESTVSDALRVCECVHLWTYVFFLPTVLRLWPQSVADTPSPTHTRPWPWSLYSCAPGGRFLHWPYMNHAGKEAWEGEMVVEGWGGFMLWQGGLRWRWTATPSTQHDTQTDRAARETLEPDKLSWLLWEWEGRGGGLVVGAGPVTQEWRRLTAHVKFMVFPGLQGNTSQRRDRQAPRYEPVVISPAKNLNGLLKQNLCFSRNTQNHYAGNISLL